MAGRSVTQLCLLLVLSQWPVSLVTSQSTDAPPVTVSVNVGGGAMAASGPLVTKDGDLDSALAELDGDSESKPVPLKSVHAKPDHSAPLASVSKSTDADSEDQASPKPAKPVKSLAEIAAESGNSNLPDPWAKKTPSSSDDDAKPIPANKFISAIVDGLLKPTEQTPKSQAAILKGSGEPTLIKGHVVPSVKRAPGKLVEPGHTDYWRDDGGADDSHEDDDASGDSDDEVKVTVSPKGRHHPGKQVDPGFSDYWRDTSKWEKVPAVPIHLLAKNTEDTADYSDTTQDEDTIRTTIHLKPRSKLSGAKSKKATAKAKPSLRRHHPGHNVEAGHVDYWRDTSDWEKVDAIPAWMLKPKSVKKSLPDDYVDDNGEADSDDESEGAAGGHWQQAERIAKRSRPGRKVDPGYSSDYWSGSESDDDDDHDGITNHLEQALRIAKRARPGRKVDPGYNSDYWGDEDVKPGHHVDPGYNSDYFDDEDSDDDESSDSDKWQQAARIKKRKRPGRRVDSGYNGDYWDSGSNGKSLLNLVFDLIIKEHQRASRNGDGAVPKPLSLTHALSLLLSDPMLSEKIREEIYRFVGSAETSLSSSRAGARAPGASSASWLSYFKPSWLKAKVNKAHEKVENQGGLWTQAKKKLSGYFRSASKAVWKAKHDLCAAYHRYVSSISGYFYPPAKPKHVPTWSEKLYSHFKSPEHKEHVAEAAELSWYAWLTSHFKSADHAQHVKQLTKPGASWSEKAKSYFYPEPTWSEKIASYLHHIKQYVNPDPTIKDKVKAYIHEAKEYLHPQPTYKEALTEYLHALNKKINPEPALKDKAKIYLEELKEKYAPEPTWKEKSIEYWHPKPTTKQLADEYWQALKHYVSPEPTLKEKLMGYIQTPPTKIEALQQYLKDIKASIVAKEEALEHYANALGLKASSVEKMISPNTHAAYNQLVQLLDADAQKKIKSLLTDSVVSYISSHKPATTDLKMDSLAWSSVADTINNFFKKPQVQPAASAPQVTHETSVKTANQPSLTPGEYLYDDDENKYVVKKNGQIEAVDDDDYFYDDNENKYVKQPDGRMVLVEKGEPLVPDEEIDEPLSHRSAGRTSKSRDAILKEVHEAFFKDIESLGGGKSDIDHLASHLDEDDDD